MGRRATPLQTPVKTSCAAIAGAVGVGLLGLAGVAGLLWREPVGSHLEQSVEQSTPAHPSVERVVPAQHTPSRTITFDEAYNHPELRPEHVRQSARKIGIDLSVYDVQYDADFSKLVDGVFENQQFHPLIYATLDHGKFTITYSPAPLKTREEIFASQMEYAPHAHMTTIWTFSKYGSGHAPSLLVFDSAYKYSNNSTSSTGDVRDLTFYSGLFHEYTHAQNIRHGLKLPGSNAPLTQEEVARLICVDSFYNFFEFNGYSQQLQFQHRLFGKMSNSDCTLYSNTYAQLDQTYQTRRTEFGQHGLVPLMDAFFATMEKDPFHQNLMKKTQDAK